MDGERQHRERQADLDIGMRQRVTRSGLVFALTILIIGLAAFASGNNLLFLTLAAMLSTFLISGLISRLGLAGLELELTLPDPILARETVYGRLALRNSKRWMTSFSIHLTGAGESGLTADLYFPVIPAGQTMLERASFRFARRGLYSDSAFRVASRFPFGFTERQVPVLVRQEVLVYPNLTPPPAIGDWLAGLAHEIASARPGRGDDFYRLRPYESRESVRLVDWKASARTGQLQVREFAEEQERQVVLFLDLDAAGGPEWFETAVECCAFLAVELARSGALVQLRTQRQEAYDTDTILKVLALAEQRKDAPAVAPNDAYSLHILFTARADRFAEHGWADAVVVDPGRLAALGADAHSDAGAASGSD